MYYKVIISKVAYVRAADEEEAREMAIQEDYIFADEEVSNVEPSCKSDIVRAMYDVGWLYDEED